MNSFLAKNVELPQETQAEDFMIMHETGAYTMSMYSKFNSIIPSPVYGFSLHKVTLSLMRSEMY